MRNDTPALVLAVMLSATGFALSVLSLLGVG